LVKETEINIDEDVEDLPPFSPIESEEEGGTAGSGTKGGTSGSSIHDSTQV